MDEKCQDCPHTEFEHAEGGAEECLECACGGFVDEEDDDEEDED